MCYEDSDKEISGGETNQRKSLTVGTIGMIYVQLATNKYCMRIVTGKQLGCYGSSLMLLQVNLWDPHQHPSRKG